MERLVELSDQEVRIDFTLNSKCRANVGLRSLIAAAPIAFKVQTSSPHKFLVNPPCGLVPPLSYITFQIILKPQDQLPPTFPRSPSDRFLIKTAVAPDFVDTSSSDSVHPDLINAWFCSRPRDSFTYDLKLKIAFVGPVLMFHAVGSGDVEAVKNLIKRQRSVVADLASSEAETLLRVATELCNSDTMINLLVENGLMIDARDQVGDMDATELHDDEVVLYDDKNMHGHMQIQLMETLAIERGKEVLNAARRGEVKVLESQLQKGYDMKYRDQYGLTPLHVASLKGHKNVVKMLIVENGGADKEMVDDEGHSPLHLAVEGGCIETVELLIKHRANVNAKTKRGATPLYIARAMGYDDISDLLLKKGASALHSSLSMFH